MSGDGNRPKARTFEVENLSLDPLNPRLAVPSDATQLDLLKRLYEEESLDELVGSFLENGYFEEEPLVVVRDADDNVVVEGNRRLATLKLLLDANLRRRVGVDDWPKLTRRQRERLSPVPAIVYSNRDEVVPYLGYRHITGARKWGPFQKARFITQLVETAYDLEQIQDLIGDETSVVKKLYQEYRVFEQAVDLGLPAKPIRDRFSLLEVALSQRPIKAFLKISHRLPTGPVDFVVPPENDEELVELITWVFGDGSEPPVITDSREISQLAKVIGDSHALKELRNTGDLEAAEEMLEGEQKSLLRRLASAERGLKAAAGLLPLYHTDAEVIAAVRRISTLVKSLTAQLGK